MRNQARIVYSALALIGGVVIWTFSQGLALSDQKDWRTGLQAIAFIFWFVGSFLLLDWIAARWIARLREFEQIKTIDRLRILEAKQRYLDQFARLTPAQLDAIGDYAVSIEHVPTTGTTPYHYVVTAGRRILFSFIDEFVDGCDDVHVAAVRTWNSGTRDRLDAEALTELFIRSGMAYRDETIENFQARWYSPQSYKAALRMISYDIVRQVLEIEAKEPEGEEV